MEVVAHDRGAFADELARQGQIEGLLGEDLLGLSGDLGKAKARPAAETLDIFQLGHIELDFPVERADHWV